MHVKQSAERYNQSTYRQVDLMSSTLKILYMLLPSDILLLYLNQASDIAKAAEKLRNCSTKQQNVRNYSPAEVLYLYAEQASDIVKSKGFTPYTGDIATSDESLQKSKISSSSEGVLGDTDNEQPVMENRDRALDSSRGDAGDTDV
ncbi:unnamed protein product [Ambrosiozyma monospora]|uniref:Unnamed protein product n=1 Tax=Ambrosiozyma monospora TaxID=43982 RepID=A0ACB5T809_AMBMO|nr:unnamed protein product [Ambrosiozyma monospora]